MRIRNKEMRQRRHRKEQIIKAAIKDAKANGGVKKEKKVAAKPAKPAAKKAAKKTEEAPATVAAE